ncbi:hypothetical protein V493_01192 [Pseudogymnoascus sp. VKM F-4281 (FW-2241)]|nr:hypothetical protein V493_01192 [Pseudogymnoascus sp. VKM F-4281 (FW-2241)]
MERPLSLTDLPHELVTQIVSHLCPANGVRGVRYQWTLSQLTQTCKGFKELFQPMLFRSYTYNEQPISHFVKFLRAIASRPDLAAAVTHLSFRYPPDATDLTITDKDFIDTCVTSLGLPLPPKDWHIEGTDRTIPIQTVIAYASCNLESLSLPVNEEWDLALLPSFSKASPKITFPRLKRLSIDYYYISGDQWAIAYNEIAPLLEASSNLEHLSLPTLERFWEHRGNCRVPKMKSLKTLNLSQSSSGMFFVTSIIRSCESLQSFELNWGTSSGYDESHEGWSVVNIWDALVHVRRTIQEITFESILDIPLGNPTANSVSSLLEFTDLKILRVDGRSFEGMFQAWTLKTRSSDMDQFVAQLLPTRIQSLTIWAPSFTLIPALFALARGKSSGLYEGLTTVEIGASTAFKHWLPRSEWLSNQTELRDEFERAGVQVKMDIPYVPPEMLEFALPWGGFIG